MDWLLLLTQLPSRPSSLRVNVWRRMKTAGAVSLQNGVWILPSTPKNERFLTEVLSLINSGGGDAMFFFARAPDRRVEHERRVEHDRRVEHERRVEQEIIEMFQAGIDQEYGEFLDRCHGLVDELERESGLGKFTFAELDENEEDLQKLTSWLRKIQARDFFESKKAADAAEALGQCKKELRAFEAAVYQSEGLGSSDVNQ